MATEALGYYELKQYKPWFAEVSFRIIRSKKAD